MLASLNHPNICGIYGIEESDSIRFLILELVEGKTLADTLAGVSSPHPNGGGLPLDDVLAIAQANRRSPRSRPRERDRAPRSEASQHQNHA